MQTGISIEDISACIRAIAMRQEHNCSKTPVYYLLQKIRIWGAVIDGAVSFSQLQKVAYVAHNPEILAAARKLADSPDIKVKHIFDFIEQYGELAEILKNQKLQSWIIRKIIDMRSLHPVKVHLLAMNDVLDIGPVFELAEELSEAVEEQALEYLQAHASPKTAEEFYDFTQLMMRVQKEGVGVIWKHIEDCVANIVFPTFVSIYSMYLEDEHVPINSPWTALPRYEETEVVEFTKLEAGCKRELEQQAYADYRKKIQAGCQTKLGDLSDIQARLERSRGHYQYCLRALYPKPKTIFFDTTQALYEGRHSSPEAQRAYDKRYGLIISTPQ